MIAFEGKGVLVTGAASGIGQATVQRLLDEGARVVGAADVPADRAWSLVACVVTPGFDYADFEIGERDELLALYPQHAELIHALT